jgi:hypothetical protein
MDEMATIRREFREQIAAPELYTAIGLAANGTFVPWALARRRRSMELLEASCILSQSPCR